MPHIYARNTDDLFFAQGYVMGQDRLWQLEMWRRQRQGRLSEILGPDTIDRDRQTRLLMYRAAWMKDHGKKTTKESSMAKLFASEISVNVCEEAIQVHGGYGYTKDYPPEKYWRDSKLCTIGEGTSEIQRIIIAREVLKQV